MEHTARFDGRVRFSGFSADELIDEITGLSKSTPGRAGYVEVVGGDGGVLQRVAVWPGHLLYVEDGAGIAAGARIAFYGTAEYRDRPFQHLRSGAARLAALLEARHPRHRAALAHFDGTVESRPGLPRTLGSVVSDGGEVQRFGRRYALVPGGARVRVGDALSEGERDHHELLRLWGRDRFESHLFEEIDEIFSLSRVIVAPSVIDLIVREAVVDTPDGPRLRPLERAPGAVDGGDAREPAPGPSRG